MAKPSTRMKRPFVASLDQVRVIRNPDGESASIEYADDNVSRVVLNIGLEMENLSEQEILDRHNEVILA